MSLRLIPEALDTVSSVVAMVASCASLDTGCDVTFDPIDWASDVTADVTERFMEGSRSKPTKPAVGDS